MNEDGFGAAILLVLLALVALVCVASADAANVLLSRARAQTAADAAALAAAAAEWPFLHEGDPADAARAQAIANGAQLESCVCPVRGSSAIVVVSVPTSIRMLGVAPRRVSAGAEARFDPGQMFVAAP